MGRAKRHREQHDSIPNPCDSDLPMLAKKRLHGFGFCGNIRGYMYHSVYEARLVCSDETGSLHSYPLILTR